jgi:hypothetical protein
MLMSIPVLIPLPGSPVLVQFSVRNPPVSGWDAAKVARDLHHGMRDSPIFYKNPSPLVGCGSIPMAVMRAVPVTLVKENVHVERGNKIDICSRYNDNGRRCGNYKTWGGRNIYPDVDIDSGPTARWGSSKDKKDSKKQNLQRSFFHSFTLLIETF